MAEYPLQIKVTADTAAAKTALADITTHAATSASAATAAQKKSLVDRVSGVSASALGIIDSGLSGIMPGAGSGMIGKAMGIGAGFVKAGASVASGLLSLTGPIGAAAGAVVGILGTVTGGLLNAFGQLGDMLMGLPKQILLAMGAMAAAFVGGIYAMHKLMGPAAQNESFKAQLSNMGKAGNLDYYTELASKGPQSLGEVVKGGITMESFGIDSKKYLQSAQDSASMFKIPIEEVSGILSRVKAGQVEQESMNRVGITKADLKGIRFDAQGSVNKEDTSKVFAAFIKAMQTRSGGMAEVMSNTYEGKVSNLGDAINTMLVKAFSNLTGYAAQWLSPVITMVDGIGAKLALIDWTPIGEAVGNVVGKATAFVSGIDWQGWGQSILGMFTGAADIVGKLFSAEGRGDLKNGLLSAWAIIVESISGVMSGVGALLKAALKEGALESVDILKNAAKASVGMKTDDTAAGWIGGKIEKAGKWLNMAVNPSVLAMESAKASYKSTNMILSNPQGVLDAVKLGFSEMVGSTGTFMDTKGSKNTTKSEMAVAIESMKSSVKGIMDRLTSAVNKATGKNEKDAIASASAALMAPLTTDTDIKQAVASNAMEDFSAAVRGVTEIKLDPKDLAGSLAAAQAAQAAAMPAMQAAKDAAGNMKSSMTAEEAQRAANGDSQFTQDKEKQDHARTLLNQNQGVVTGESAMANKILQIQDAIKAAAKEQNSFVMATNKLLAGMLAEIKALNDYNQSDIAASYFA